MEIECLGDDPIENEIIELFMKMRDDIIAIPIPPIIEIYTDRLDLVFGDARDRTLKYFDYGTAEISTYRSVKEEGGENVLESPDQLLMLAKRIKKLSRGYYNIEQKLEVGTFNPTPEKKARRYVQTHIVLRMY